MKIHIDRVKRLRMYTEPNGSFAVDNTDSMGEFTDIPAIEGSVNITLGQDTVDPGYLLQSIYDHNEEVLKPVRGGMSFDINLSALTTMAGTGATAAQGPVGMLLKAYMGGEDIGEGGKVDGKTDADTFSCTTSSDFADGTALGWVNASSELELRSVVLQSGDTINVQHDFSATVATNDVIYACRTYYFDHKTSSTVTSLQAVLEGMGDSNAPTYEDGWCFFGGQSENPMKITLANGEIPRLSFEYTYANWLNTDDAAITPAALSEATYSNTEEVLIADSSFYVGTVGNSTATEYHPSEITLELGQKYVPVSTPGGTNNILQWMANPDHPVVFGTFTLPFEDQTWVDHRASKTDLYISLQIGSTTAGGAILINIPTVQITDVKRVDAGGIMAQTVSFKGRHDAGTTATTNLAKSPLRISIF